MSDMHDENIKVYKFPDDFKFACATAAYQVNVLRFTLLFHLLIFLNFRLRGPTTRMDEPPPFGTPSLMRVVARITILEMSPATATICGPVILK